MSAKFRISWPKIVQRLGASEIDAPFFFVIPDAGRHLLLSSIDRLRWEKTYDVDGYDYADSDERNAIVEATYRALFGGESMSEISDAIRYLADNLDLIVTVDNSNTNQNSGGSGCCTQFEVPTDPNGTDYPLVPLNPSDPLGENIPTWDDGTQTPPDGYDDWQSFVDNRCKAANWMVDSFLIMVRDSDLLERQLSAGETIVEVASVLLKALPGPIGEWAGTVVLMRWIGRVVGIIADAVGALEELNDYLQLAADKIEENKEEYICAAYSMTSVSYLQEFFLTFFAGYVSPELTAAGADPTMVNWVRDWMRPLTDELAKRVADGIANQSIPVDYLPSVDCATCGNPAPNGWIIETAVLDSVRSFRLNSGGSNPIATINPDGSVNFTFDATTAGASVDMNLFMLKPAIATQDRYKGLMFNLEVVSNANGAGFRLLASTDVGSSQIWDGVVTTQDAGEVVLVRSGATIPFPEPYQDATVYQGTNCKIDACDVIQLDLRVGATAAAGGQVEVRVSNFRWLRSEGLACP